MKLHKILLLLFTIVISLSVSGSLSADKNDTLGSAIKSFADSKKAYRITVSQFKNTADKKTKFDGYIADTIIHELSKYTNFKLIERQRLSKVMAELNLNTSGVINANQAQKIGNLLPVDLVGTGSYTIIGSKITVNGRFISVVTGEIVHTISYSFEADEKTIKATLTPISQCEKIHQEVTIRLKNLNGKQNINKAVEAAIKVPFDMECGKIHLKVTRVFENYKIYPDKYKQFLLTTLSGLENPSDDGRAAIMLNFLKADGKIDQEEWKTGKEVLKRSTKMYFTRYARALLNVKNGKERTIEKRIDEIIQMGKQKSIGRPVVFDNSYIVVSTAKAVSRYSYTNKQPLYYIIKNYHKLIDDNDSMTYAVFYILKNIYTNKRLNTETRAAAIDSMTLFLKHRKPSERIARYLFYLAEDMEEDSEKNTDVKLNKSGVSKINSELSGWFCYLHKNSTYKRLITKTGEYMQRHNIKCK